MFIKSVSSPTFQDSLLQGDQSSTVSNDLRDLEVSILQTENHPSFPSPYISFLTNLRQQTTSIGTWTKSVRLKNRCDFYYRNDPRQKSFLLGSRKSGPTKSSNSISQSSWTGCVQCDFNGSICRKSQKFRRYYDSIMSWISHLLQPSFFDVWESRKGTCPNSVHQENHRPTWKKTIGSTWFSNSLHNVNKSGVLEWDCENRNWPGVLISSP